MKTESNPISDEAILELGCLCTEDRCKVIKLLSEPTASCYLTLDLQQLGITRSTANTVAYLNRNHRYYLISNLALTMLMDYQQQDNISNQETNELLQ